MKRTLIIAFVAFLVINIGIFGYIGISGLYRSWGRRLIYPSSSKTTNFPGSDELIKHEAAQIFVIPINMTTPFFNPASDANKYSAENYNVISIPAQDRMVNAVGTFQGWENITGSDDKYLTIYYPFTKSTKKIRVSFNSFGIYQDQPTSLWVEDVGLRLNSNDVNPIKPAGSLSKFGYNLLQKIITKGDAMIVVPVTSIPVLSPTDSNSNYLANEIMIRRIGGITEFNKEIK